MGVAERLIRVARVWTDALAYAVVLTVAVTVGAFTLGIATGGGFVRGNLFLFLSGWVLLAYATVRLWPTSIESEETAEEMGERIPGENPSRFQSFVRSLPLVRWISLPAPDERMTQQGKLFVTSLLVLCASFLIETFLGVG